jgi:DNA mismatch repair ATPase MutS
LVDDSQVSVLCFQVGDFYEAIGIDACILVEYAGLNPFGGLRSDSVPRAGCPFVVLDLHPSFVIVDFLDLECL